MHEIHQAVIDGNLEKIKALQGSGTNINLEDENGRTVLHLAIIHNHENLIEPLLALGANVQATDNNFKKPLFYAAKTGNVSITDKLINGKAKLEYGTYGTAYWFVTQGITTGIEKFKDWKVDLERDPLMQLAQEYGQLAAIPILEKFGLKRTPRKINKRELYFVFGGKKLEELIHYEGGKAQNAQTLFLYYLTAYFDEKIKENKIDPLHAKKVCTRLRKLFEAEKSTTEILQKLREENRVDIFVECADHGLGISLQINPDQKNKATLYILDHTMARFIRHKDAIKHSCIQAITLDNDPDLFQKIIQQLKNLSDSPETELENFILKEIPILANSEYQPLEQPKKSLPKAQSCFLSNVKLTAEKIIFDEFGIKEGLQIYKDFTLYFRENVANDFFSTNVASNFEEITFNQQAEKIIRGILMEKKSKSDPIICEEEQVSALKSP